MFILAHDQEQQNADTHRDQMQGALDAVAHYNRQIAHLWAREAVERRAAPERVLFMLMSHCDKVGKKYLKYFQIFNVCLRVKFQKPLTRKTFKIPKNVQCVKPLIKHFLIRIFCNPKTANSKTGY